MDRHVIRTAALAVCATIASSNAQPKVSIKAVDELVWSTAVGNTYQAQASKAGGPWIDLTPEVPGDGGVHTIFCGDPGLSYQVLEIIPGAPGGPVTTNAAVNGGFESGGGELADNWTATSSQPPVRTDSDAHLDSFSMRGRIVNVSAEPGEGLLAQRLVPQGSSVTAGETYDFSFWAKQISLGPSYVQQYEMQWLDGAGGVIGSTGLRNFSGTIGQWDKISVPNLVAPAGAVDARISFRFVTGAVPDGSGEVLLDDVALESTSDSGPPAPPEINSHPFTVRRAVRLSWPTATGTDYLARWSPDLAPGSWSDLAPRVTGDGNPHNLDVPITMARQFFRVESPAIALESPTDLRVVSSGSANSIGLAWTASTSQGATGYRILFGPSPGDLPGSLDVGIVTSAVIPDLTPGQTYYIAVVTLGESGQSPLGTVTLSAQPGPEAEIIPLYDASTVLEVPTSIVTPSALITRIADRARDRHAREAEFNSYDHYLSWYWEQRIANLEIIDRVGRNGGTDITFNYTTHAALSAAEFRTFFRGLGTVAEYHNNQIATLVGTNPSATPGETDFNYTASVSSNPRFNRPLQQGDRIEIELSQFIAAPRNGRNNYYGTALLYIVGQGIVPWAEGRDLGFDGGIVGTTNQSLDSYPLPTDAWLGGLTTLPYQYSDEPEHRFKQTAGNISPTNGRPFMLGRRLHHTDFGNGAHTETGNPVFTGQIGKLGPKFVTRSCVDCHGNNGRALPPAVGSPLLPFGVRVGADSSGSPHPTLGEQLQPGSVSGPVEGGATLASYTIITGQYGDGTTYSLRKPNYTFQGTSPSYFSVRIAPQLVGLGLLEAIGEDTILGLADPDDSDGDGISGRIHVVEDPQTGQSRLGRFGYKASQARVVHQIAHALNYDLGVTTSIFPIPDGETSPVAVELGDSELDEMNRYVSLLGVGARRDLSDAQAQLGEQLFQTASCTDCHIPELTTSPHHPMAELRDQTIHPYTNMLLHDMGPGLADNMAEEGASASEWRTAPLWNIGLTAGVSGGEAYLHDGRARTLEEAILWHGGEAESSKQQFLNMSAADRAALVAFLKSL